MRGDPETVASVLGLKRSGGDWKGPCPICGGKDRFHIRRGYQHDLVLHCRYGCRFQDLAAMLQSMGLIEDDRDKWQTIEDDRDEHEPLLRAFIADIDRGNGIGQTQKRLAKRAIYKLTGFSPDDLLYMYLFREAFAGNLDNPAIDYTKKDYEIFETVHKAVSGREWLIRGCACLTSKH